ncbi:ras-like protein family member 12 isoform X1 [Centruroides vittatus]|uniref:ras-like protein family member 12 isoform X1 n=1 Tax=Centruroides vittatus TaxID=120091 RepID=UPI00350F56DC
MSGRRTPTGPSVSLPEINLAILGSLGVGKSALTVKYITKRFINEYDPELENTYSKVDVVDQKEVILNIMDTCDKDYKTPDRYLKWADGFIIVYSITNRSSFEQANSYMDLVQNSSPREIPLILVGNKVDLERYRQVSKQEGINVATKYEATFLESTAAEEYDEVAAVFQETVRQILRREANKSLYIGESAPTNGTRLLNTRSQKSPVKSSLSARKNEEPNRSLVLAERNPKMKLFNKGFKIFQS